jgi:hypothetical protein
MVVQKRKMLEGVMQPAKLPLRNQLFQQLSYLADLSKRNLSFET